MKLQTVLIATASIAVCTLAAGYRFSDSAHVMGVIKKGGGTVRHGANLDPGRKRTSLIVTARVVPPYRGDARVVLEKAPGYTYTLYNSEPAISLPFRHRPSFTDNTYRDLRPHDKVALWVVMEQKQPSPNVLPGPGEGSSDCCLAGADRGKRGARGKGGGEPKGPFLAFYDAASRERLLTVPLQVGSAGGAPHGR